MNDIRNNTPTSFGAFTIIRWLSIVFYANGEGSNTCQAHETCLNAIDGIRCVDLAAEEPSEEPTTAKPASEEPTTEESSSSMLHVSTAEII